MLFGRKDNAPKTEITSLQKLTLRVSGMRVTEVYEILDSNGQAEVSLYHKHYSREGDSLVLQKRTCTDMPRMLALLKDCGVGEWNGFVGHHPRHVRDGQMFELTAEVNGGGRIYAHGSENFPRHYHDFVRALCELLAGCEVDQGED
ncbi:MAG: hypothetical protein IKN17_09035 [Ruminococcus sp.]|nr:hypothetical protein [Ruminococcus sp.]